METKIYKNRKQAMKFANKVKGKIEWFEKPSLRKIKSKQTGRMKYKPIIKTYYKVIFKF